MIQTFTPACDRALACAKTVFQKTHAEDRGDKPERQMQRAHPRDGFGGLREDPRHRREADEQDGHQHEQSGQQATDFGQPGLRAAQAG